LFAAGLWCGHKYTEFHWAACVGKLVWRFRISQKHGGIELELVMEKDGLIADVLK
jgi:hypothetical protein